MIQLTAAEIKAKIKAKTGLSEEEIGKLMQEKLSALAGLISPEGAAHIVANELGVKLFDPTNLKVKDVLIGMRSIDLTGKAIKKYEERVFKTGDREGRVANLLFGDETGSTRVVLWNKQVDHFHELNEGDILKLVGAYVKDNQGRPELHLSDASRIIINPAGVSVQSVETQQVQTQPKRKFIVNLSDQDGTVEILATIVQLYDIKYYQVCPQCNKKLADVTCELHGPVLPVTKYVLNCFVDDGSGNIRVVFFQDQVRQLLKKTDDELQALRGSTSGMDSFKTDLLGSIISVVGRANKNQVFDRLELVASFVNPSPQPQQEFAKLDDLEPFSTVPIREQAQPTQKEPIVAEQKVDFEDVE